MTDNTTVDSCSIGGYRREICEISIGEDYPIDPDGEPDADAEFAVMSANARLIAAAPDMLAALEAEEAIFQHERVCDDCADGTPCDAHDDLWKRAHPLRQVALAKAKGESDHA